MLTAKELAMFKALGHNISQDTPYLMAYSIAPFELMTAKHIDLGNPVILSLRRCIKAIKDGEPQRGTKEFADLIDLGSEKETQYIYTLYRDAFFSPGHVSVKKVNIFTTKVRVIITWPNNDIWEFGRTATLRDPVEIWHDDTAFKVELFSKKPILMPKNIIEFEWELTSSFKKDVIELYNRAKGIKYNTFLRYLKKIFNKYGEEHDSCTL
jgi:hypothetical protein